MFSVFKTTDRAKMLPEEVINIISNFYEEIKPRINYNKIVDMNGIAHVHQIYVESVDKECSVYAVILERHNNQGITPILSYFNIKFGDIVHNIYSDERINRYQRLIIPSDNNIFMNKEDFIRSLNYYVSPQEMLEKVNLMIYRIANKVEIPHKLLVLKTIIGEENYKYISDDIDEFCLLQQPFGPNYLNMLHSEPLDVYIYILEVCFSVKTIIKKDYGELL